MLLNYKDIRKVMADYRGFSSEPQISRPVFPRPPIPALEMDPPRHAAWRAVFSAALKPKTPEEMAPFVRADVRRHISRFRRDGHCEIVGQLCEPLPAETIFHVVGIEEDKVPEISRAGIQMIGALGVPEEFGRHQAHFAKLVMSEVELRRINPRDDFLTSVINMQIEGRKLGDTDIVALLFAFLGGGHHSTTSAMASIINHVFSRPALRDSLIEDSSRISTAIEETLRLSPPFFGFFRRTTRPVEISGIAIPEGKDIYLSWAAANRDPTIFEEPETFRLDRENNRHFSFGFGIHSCAGAALARMELRVMMEELLAAFPDLEVVGPVQASRFGGGNSNCIPELEVRFTI